MAGDEFAVAEKCAAHARAERQQKTVAQSARRAAPHFAEQRGVRVIEHRHRHAALEKRRPVQAHQSGEPPWHFANGARIRRGAAWRGESDVLNAPAGFLLQNGERLAHTLPPGIAAERLAGRERRRELASAFIIRRRLDLRAADVESRENHGASFPLRGVFPNISSAQPAMKSTPPSGVTGPSHDHRSVASR